MQKTVKLLLQRKFACAFSLILAMLIIDLDVEGNIQSRWGAMFSGIGTFLVVFILLLMWLVHFVWLLLKRPQVIELGGASLLALAFGVLLFFAAHKISATFEARALNRDIQPAVSAGLYRDCMQLLQSWPTNQDYIFSSDTNFSQLPASIKMLKPAYVGKSIYGDPPNIGICKNGFGGFAQGIRVFRNDEDALKFSNNTRGAYQRIAPGIYIWWHPT